MKKAKSAVVCNYDDIYSSKKSQDIVSYCIQNLTKDEIIKNAKKNGEHPFGFIIDYIKDIFHVSKIEAFPIAQKVLEALSLTNSEC